MKRQLFFDDHMLFARDNVIREYGEPELQAVYTDGICSTDFYTGFVFRLDNGKFRMLYFGHGTGFSGRKLFSAISEDGIHFEPETLQDTEKEFPNEVMILPKHAEVADIVEDTHCESEEERYKLLMSEHNPDGMINRDTTYVSKDLLHWNLKEEAFWGEGAEPLVSVFYNEHSRAFTIMQRPDWGVRRVGYKETKDWKNFSPYQECLNVDALDEPLAEIYGISTFEYEGMYIGLPHMYRNLKGALNAKYFHGSIDTQLAYSYDGHYWQRSLREPFISGLPEYQMVWVADMLRCDDGSINFYASASELEHGFAFSRPGTGKIHIYKLREDGFLSLSTKEGGQVSTVATREKLWNGGELHFNLKAEHATVAVYQSDESEAVAGNVLGSAHPIEGYGHEDCLPFSGDATDWVPQFSSGKKVEELSGKTLVFELKFLNGKVFSLSGDYTDLFNTQAARYRKFGTLPNNEKN